ncbi:LysR substrate-binding domain-containing protein [Pseudomonas fuscovaginae UPB0736]|uniref:LysR substrate-binding domain-containing protein n=1 Tax=Pseudomonas asplenii TaxID=53407 RepID=UPI00028A236D|nr:LysR substrate-binding domain-containing protein [Pseudomonas fuscovaginae]UUQ63808.1 LysR substrate-binding domain-containing protein [Pseudomonas fuscovaginae UPB0736]
MKLPALTSFHFFTIAAQTQSFVQAARLLHVTHGAVSRQVRLLEEAIGVELFERRNRAIFLNDAGRLLYNVTRPFFEQLESTVYELQREVREEILVVSCEPTIAMKWLIPRLPDFHAAHPNLQLQLLAAGGPIDFARSGVDVAMRRDDFYWEESIHCETICEEWIGPVCMPSLWPEGQLLDGMRLLRSKTRPLAWDNWMRLADVTAPKSMRLDYEHFYLCIQAAVAGLGVSISSLLMVQDELKSGQLIAPFGFKRDGSRYCLLSPRPFKESPKCMAFLNWVTEQMAGSIRGCEVHEASNAG